jgi:hypothetical protein
MAQLHEAVEAPATPTPPPPTEHGPNWIRDALRQLVDEVALFSRTAATFTAHPRRFANDWVGRRGHALNPLAFLATALAVGAPVNALIGRITHEASEPTRALWLDALATVTPFTYYLTLGTFQHGVLRLFGSRRRVSESWAMALYAGGGPALAAHLLMLAVSYVFYRVTGQLGANRIDSAISIFLLVGAVASFLLFCVTLALAFGGLHGRDGIRGWQLLVANVVALLASAHLLGLYHPPGDFGLHLVIHWRRDGHFSVSLRLIVAVANGRACPPRRLSQAWKRSVRVMIFALRPRAPAASRPKNKTRTSHHSRARRRARSEVRMARVVLLHRALDEVQDDRQVDREDRHAPERRAVRYLDHFDG